MMTLLIIELDITDLLNKATKLIIHWKRSKFHNLEAIVQEQSKNSSSSSGGGGYSNSHTAVLRYVEQSGGLTNMRELRRFSAKSVARTHTQNRMRYCHRFQTKKRASVRAWPMCLLYLYNIIIYIYLHIIRSLAMGSYWIACAMHI